MLGMTTIAQRAAARAAYQSAHGPKFGTGECMLRNRLLVDAPAIGDYDGDGMADAEDGWKFAKRKHPTTRVNDIPGGCFVWWGGGSHDNGHVAFAPIEKPGYCWSTDIERAGYFDLVPIGRITAEWGLPLRGWSEDIDGVTVYEPPPPPPPREDPDMTLLADLVAVARKHDVTLVKAARVALRRAGENARTNHQWARLAAIHAARVALKGWK
jgi:hypothetical protein